MSSTGPTLAELGEKLSKLRAHFDQVVAVLKAPPDHGAVRARSGGDHRRLRCHDCGRVGSKDEAGWTLRLLGDDELHAFCPDCDGFGGNGIP